jgi:hypothetical protein
MDLVPLLSQMLTILHQQVSSAKERGGLGPEALFQIARVASDYSERQRIDRDDVDCATPLSSAVFLDIGRLSNSIYGTEKAQAYLEYDLHCQRQGELGDSFLFIWTWPPNLPHARTACMCIWSMN